MKKLFSILFTFFALATIVVAQTPQEIVSKMESEIDKHENEGVIMSVDVKIPILGTMSTKSYTLGDKSRVEANWMGYTIITWIQGATQWEYNSKTNEVEISTIQEKAGSNDDLEMFQGITDGYDVSIDKETSDAWYLYCKKSKSNPDKDAPKRMDLVVAKGTYMPMSLSAKMNGSKMTLYDFSFGVTEKQVTFNPADYPNAKIKDLR